MSTLTATITTRTGNGPSISDIATFVVEIIQNLTDGLESRSTVSTITQQSQSQNSATSPATSIKVSTVGPSSFNNQSSAPLVTITSVTATPCPAEHGGSTQSCLKNDSGEVIQVTPVTVTTSTVIFASAGSSATTSPIVYVNYQSVFSSNTSTSITSSSLVEPSKASSTVAATVTSALSTKTPAPVSGVTAAAVAGAAVGGLVAGALIVGLMAFCIFKKKSRRDRYITRNAGTYVPAAGPAYGGEKGTPMVSIAPIAMGLDFLPQQADDADVKRRLSTIADQVDQHVENFYCDRGVSLSPNMESGISRFETSELPFPLAACFQNAANPMILIKHCLAFHIFNLTLAPGQNSHPLLPAEISGMVTAMYHTTMASNTPRDVVAAFSAWKSLTNYLRPNLARDTGAGKSLSDNSARMAAQFTTVFLPWANPQFTPENRVQHLTELINHAVQMAVWLFGQPDNFRFEWDAPVQNTRQTNNRVIVIVPAVWKTTHAGTRLNGKGQNILLPITKSF